MKKIFALGLSVISFMGFAQNQDSIMISKIYREVLLNGTCYNELHDLCKNIGHRVAGSESADRAILWAKVDWKPWAPIPLI